MGGTRKKKIINTPKNNPPKTKKYKKHNKTFKTLIYSESDYNSGDGMLTSVWGPSIWHFLHTMSFNYPVNPTKEDKKHYRDFIINLQYTLPCKYCRMNLKTNLKQSPLNMSEMKNRESFSKYVYNLHEIINTMLKKKSNLSYEEVRDRYEHFRSRCTDIPKLNKTKKIKVKETGCTEPLYGQKSKCIIKIVPQEEKGDTFQMDKKCIKTKK
jgi:hypothetical protein